MSEAPGDFVGAEPAVWTEAIEGPERELVRSLLEGGLTEEEAATLWLSKFGADHMAGFGAASGAQNYLASVQRELKKVLCGAPEYDDVRQKASGVWAASKPTIIAAVAGAIAVKLGIAVAVLSPVVGLLLAATAKVGLRAWCNLPDPETTTSPQ